MRARTRLHRHDAAWRQLRAPGQELFAPQRPVRRHASAAVHRVRLDHPLGQIHAYPNDLFSDNLAHGTSPFHSCKLMTHTTNLGASTPLLEGGKSLRIPVKGMSTSGLRPLAAAPYVERQASQRRTA